jgi:hypothetical protein
MLVNTQYFREQALHFQKYGHYDDGDPGTYHYENFWEEEMRRCMVGYKVGDTWVTGYHYWYLNYWHIEVTRENSEQLYGEVIKSRRKKADRLMDFAEFWDVDYRFFHECELAENEGSHMLWLKPRGCGASYKASGMIGRNFFCIPDSKSYMFAFEKEYLLKEGLYSKFLNGRSFVNKKHPFQDRYVNAFGKPSDFKKDSNGMVYRASTNINGEEQGYMSSAIGVTFKDDWQKGRGKRGKLITWDEMGKFPNVDKSWNVTRDSVEEGDKVYGLMIGVGTGGTEGADFSAMEKMFYNPKVYNVRGFDNIWDEGMAGTKCGFFTSAIEDIAFKDKDGNSDQVAAKKHYDQDRKDARESIDPNDLLQRKAEKPYCPADAILNTADSIMPKGLAKEHRMYLQASGLDKIMGIGGVLQNVAGTIKFSPNDKVTPIVKFPHNKSDDLTGCVVQYFAPYKVDGIVPDNLYIIAHDPYAHDDSSNMESLGATYVYMQPNKYQPPGDKLVATYFGRPKTQDAYNKILFDLADYYNAKIGFENDRGDVIGYAKRFKKLHKLEDQFELAFDAGLKGSKVNRTFGMHMGSGKENKRKNQGDKYLADWLISPRGTTVDGKELLNIHTIYCPSTLAEIEGYRTGGNFDRISALRILVYHQKELDYKDRQVRVKKKTYDADSLWNTKLYA